MLLADALQRRLCVFIGVAPRLRSSSLDTVTNSLSLGRFCDSQDVLVSNLLRRLQRELPTEWFLQDIRD